MSSEIRICTITDGLDAVLLAATFLSSLRGSVTRDDFSFPEASELLGQVAYGTFSLIVVVPRAATGRGAEMLRQICVAATERAAAVLVLLPADAEIPHQLPPEVRILRGPPYPTRDIAAVLASAERPSSNAAPLSPAAPQARGFGLARLFGRGDVETGSRAEAATSKPPPEVIVVQKLCGGAGATTIATVLARELARQGAADPAAEARDAAVCLLDLDLQFGSCGAYFVLLKNSKVDDAYRNLRTLDGEAFRSCLQSPVPGLQVFQVPCEMVPMDALDGASVDRLIALAQSVASRVIIDMPQVVTDWSERVYLGADRVFLVGLLEMRAVRGARLFLKMMEALSVPSARLHWLINRAPRRYSAEWEERRKGFEAGLGRPVNRVLPEGGSEVAELVEFGGELLNELPGNVFASELADLVASLAWSRRKTPGTFGR